MSNLNEAASSVKSVFDGIGKFFYYISHPLDSLRSLIIAMDTASFFLCMIICLASVIAYICGWEKGKRYAIGSVMVFVVIQMLNAGGI